jgi:hypothetical protein
MPDNFNVREVRQHIASATNISLALEMRLLDIFHADKINSGGNFVSAREAGLMEDPTDYDPSPSGGKGRGAVLRSSPSPTADGFYSQLASVDITPEMKKGVERGQMLFSSPTQRGVTTPSQSVFWTAVMNSPKQTEKPQEPLKEPSDKAKSFSELLEEGRQETLKRGWHVNYGLGKLVPRSSLNYPAKG